MNVVLLIWYSNKNFGFRKIESFLASKIDFEIWKCPIFASSASNRLTRYEQILSGCSLGCKNALNFTCLTKKFHYPVHTNIGHESIWQWESSFVIADYFSWAENRPMNSSVNKNDCVYMMPKSPQANHFDWTDYYCDEKVSYQIFKFLKISSSRCKSLWVT